MQHIKIFQSLMCSGISGKVVNFCVSPIFFMANPASKINRSGSWFVPRIRVGNIDGQKRAREGIIYSVVLNVLKNENLAFESWA